MQQPAEKKTQAPPPVQESSDSPLLLFTLDQNQNPTSVLDTNNSTNSPTSPTNPLTYLLPASQDLTLEPKSPLFMPSTNMTTSSPTRTPGFPTPLRNPFNDSDPDVCLPTAAMDIDNPGISLEALLNSSFKSETSSLEKDLGISSFAGMKHRTSTSLPRIYKTETAIDFGTNNKAGLRRKSSAYNNRKSSFFSPTGIISTGTGNGGASITGGGENDRKSGKFDTISEHFVKLPTKSRFQMWTSKTGTVESWDGLSDFGPDAVAMIKETECFWLDVLAPTTSEIRVLSKVFGIHPLTVEDIENQENREKCDLFRHYYFVVTRYLDEYDVTYEDPQTMYMLVRKEGIISFHYNENRYTQQVYDRLLRLKNFVQISPNWINYAILDAITDSFGPLTAGVEMEVENIDELALVLHENEQTDMLRRIGSCRKVVTTLLRLLVGKLDMMKSLIKRSSEDSKNSSNKSSTIVTPDTDSNKFNVDLDGPIWDAVLYLGDVQDHLLLMLQELAQLDASLNRAHQNYLAQISIEVGRASNRTNDVVGKLTFFASVLLPLNLVTGLFGMNVNIPFQTRDPPEDLSAFVGILITCAVISLTMIIIGRLLKIL
ncbi:CorA metal ion transporter [Nowakowskiella sp. JEL0407]|nr:CorA metal ion transporter [Nowakowskiella sp. JEL0407]